VNNYDFICLHECRITADDSFNLPGYSTLVFPRSTSRGGGIVIFFLQIFLDGNVKVIENIYDSTIRITINPGIICDQALLFAYCYDPPENSQFYHENDIDLFQSLENSICKYKI
jgi:hypothetical protein